MYLKTITVENAGPITNLRCELPFRDGLPLPLVLVGPNGSGKSTLLSFIVGALVAFKQQAFEEAEVEQDRVYRMRGPLFIRSGSRWSHAKVEFEGGLSLEEWVLDRPRKEFEGEVHPLPVDDGWRQIPEDQSDQFSLTPSPQNRFHRVLSKPIQKIFSDNVVQFFPSDRFEPPDWLNVRSLASELRFPEAVNFKDQTARRIFSRALLHPTLEWVKAVTLDARLIDYAPMPIRFGIGGEATTRPGFVLVGGRSTRILDFVGKVLARILNASRDGVQFALAPRDTGIIAAKFVRDGRIETVPNLLGLSAGQAALFCIFCNVIRDFDLTGRLENCLRAGRCGF